MKYDVGIVGAGPAGLVAAIVMARAGAKVLVLEKNPLPGKKLAVCGGGNCNIGPREREVETLASRYGAFKDESGASGSGNEKTGPRAKPQPFRKARVLFHAFPPECVQAWLETSIEKQYEFFPGFAVHGLGTRLRNQDGQLFPADHDAPGFRDYLYALALEAGADVRLNRTVSALQACSDGWTIHMGPHVEHCSKLIIATGGASYPTIGGTDAGCDLLHSLGVSTRKGLPAMGGFHIRGNRLPLAKLSGIVIPASASLWDRGGALIERGGPDQLLFTHRGVSGPAVLDLCGRAHEQGAAFLDLDLVPSMTESGLLEHFAGLSQDSPQRQILTALAELVPRALAQSLLDLAGMKAETTLAVLPKKERVELLRSLKSLRLELRLPTPWTEVMSWTGGVLPSSLEWPGLQVRGHHGLWVVGDMVALDRPCGGYSLWFAWTSALAASRSILADLSADPRP